MRWVRRVASGTIAGLGLCVLFGGCAVEPLPTVQRSVRIALAEPGGTETVLCVDHEINPMIAERRFEQAQKVSQEYCELDLFAGTLLEVHLAREVDGKRETITFPLIHDGRLSSLSFASAGCAAFLNGKPVFLDMGHPQAVAWLDSQPPARLRSMRSIRLSGRPDRDLRALSRFAGSGVLVVLDKPLDLENRPELLRALLEVRPTGLVTDRWDQFEPVSARLTNLTHLCLKEPKVPDLRHLRRLRFLKCQFLTSDPSSLEEVAKLPQLRALFLENCEEVKDYGALARLKRLRSLVLSQCKQLRDLDTLAELSDLRSLTLFECEGLESISALSRLVKLTHLAIVPIPRDVTDLGPLVQLKQLKVLIVDKNGLEKRESEYQAVRRERPELEIIGFCMGSAWMTVILPSGVLLALVLRKRRKAGTRR